ncbi:RHS repeat-associated core domain-containing protein [Myroides odoratus]
MTCPQCKECYDLPGGKPDEYGFIFAYCELVKNLPPLPRDPEPEPEPDPVFPEEDLEPGDDNDHWKDDQPSSENLEVDPFEQHGPVWWYHSDHLGSTSYITDVFGTPVQYIEYLPFGEVMVEESNNNMLENVYKFNSKELDAQTGYYYYGARYYDPGASVFLSVDPLAEKYPNINPYVYVANNPIMFIDPDGRKIIIPNIVGKNPNGPENSKQRAAILNNMQKLTNEKLGLVKINGGYEVRRVGKETMNSDKTLTNGTELVSGLMDSDKTISVELGQRNMTLKSKNGDSSIIFNPNDKGDTIMNEDGSTGRPAFIGLGHEFIHADENVNGTVDHTRVNIINPDGSEPGEVLKGIKQDELNVRERENGIRAEQGIIQRKTPKKID